MAGTWYPLGRQPNFNIGTIVLLLDGRLMVHVEATRHWQALTPGPDGRYRSGSWSALADMKRSRRRCIATVGADGRASIYGGESDTDAEATVAEIYDPASDAWSSAESASAPPANADADPVMNEIGPGLLLRSGELIFFGVTDVEGNAKTVRHAPPACPGGIGTWTPGPDIPHPAGRAIVCNDCPATLLPNGKVLFTGTDHADDGPDSLVLFFEYDPAANAIAKVPFRVMDAASFSSEKPSVHRSKFLQLPSGELLLRTGSRAIHCYVPDGSPAESWRPAISSVTAHGGTVADSYLLQGTQLSGSCAPDYPLISLSDAAGSVFYCRTDELESLEIGNGVTLQSVRFTVCGPGDGAYELRVIANGIASASVPFVYRCSKTKRAQDVVLKREFEFIGKLVAESDPFPLVESSADAAPAELQTRLKLLQSSVRRIEALIAIV